MAFVLSACSSAVDGPGSPDSPGDAAEFCARWPEVRAALVTEFDSSDEWEIRSDVGAVRYALDGAAPLVPTALLTDWEVAIGFQDTVVTLLEIADYQPARLPQQLIDAAFGEGGAETASAASAQGIERVDAWAFNECGDFCELWPRLDRALGWGSGSAGGGDMEWHIITRGAVDEVLILLADDLVPEAVRADWDAAASMKLSMVDLYRSWGWEPPWDQGIGGESIQDGWLAAFGITQREIERFFEQGGGEGLEGDPMWWVGSQKSADHRAVISDWVGDNCEVVGTSGMSGTVTIDVPAGNPTNLLMAAVRRGADLGEIDDASDFFGVACSGEHWTGQSWSVPLLARDGDFRSPCTAFHMGHIVVTEALLPAGEYDLFVGTFPTGYGNFEVYVPAPESCAVVPFTVDGDTHIELPELVPCELGPLAGTPEEIARREPLPEPVGPSGTLHVLFTEYFPEARNDNGLYRVVVLPHGTTLNDLGRGYVWPVGTGCMHNRPLNDEEDRGGVDPEARRVILSEGVAVPISVFPVSVDGGYCGDPVAYAGFDPQRTGPDPIVLAAGDYDIYLFLEAGDDGREAGIRLCTHFTVAVTGDTVATAPLLEGWEDCG